MKEILTPAEKIQAASFGWELAHVVDEKTRKCSIRAFPTQANTVKSSELIHRAISARAMAGDTFARRVFSIISESTK
jgi:hypothetical protein